MLLTCVGNIAYNAIMDIENQDILELSPRQKLAQRISAIIIIVLAGVFLLLSGVVHAFPHIRVVLAVTILLAFALIFLFAGLIGKNKVSIWISIAFFVPVVVEFLVIFYVVIYSQIYPVYIAIPFIASLIVGLIWRNLRPHLFVMILFGGLAMLFALQSTGIANRIDGLNGWAFVLPLAGALLIGAMVWVGIKLTRKNKN